MGVSVALMAAALAVAALAGGGIWLVVAYNRLVRLRNLIREAWSGIEVQLKRRHDLIPALIEAVKGYAAHERSVFAEVAELRTRAASLTSVSARGEAEEKLTETLGRLVAVAEAYPELKASQNYLDLQQNLAEIEDQIQLSRRYYNGTVRENNTAIESVPDLLVARLFGFTVAEFFAAAADERVVPRLAQ